MGRMNPGSSSYVPSKAKTLAEKRAKLQVGVLFIYSWCHENGYFSLLSFNYFSYILLHHETMDYVTKDIKQIKV